MKFKSHALKIKHFVEEYTNIISSEVLNRIGQLESDYPNELIEPLRNLTDDELYSFDKKEKLSKLKGTKLQELLDQINELSEIDFIKTNNEVDLLEPWAWKGIKSKKRHEIEIMAPIIKKFNEENKFNYIADIGGGVGHLSRVLAHYYGLSCLSIDRNKEFQEIGKEHLNKYRKLDIAKTVEFINLTFGENENSPEYQETINKIFHEDVMTLGLHTCGNLANILIDQTIRYNGRGLLSFGCCYYSMNSELHLNQSAFYKENNFPKLNSFALSLATRNHCERDEEVFKTKRQVKYYRYAFHLLLIDKFNIHDAYSIGECHNREYWKPFSSYAKLKLKDMNLEHNFSDEELEKFYYDEERQKELKQFFILNLFRWRLGRPLEIYLLLDRCLWLQENNYEVNFHQYFEEERSPRNLGILAKKLS